MVEGSLLVFRECGLSRFALAKAGGDSAALRAARHRQVETFIGSVVIVLLDKRRNLPFRSPEQ